MRDPIAVRSVLRTGCRALIALTVLSLAACGGGGGSSSSSGSGGSTGTSSFTIGGSVSGLSASGLILQDNGGDNLTVASGASTFTFATQVASGGAYAVTVLTQPSGATCTVTNGSGTATANVTSVKVACVATYTVAGTITGPLNAGLKLQDYSGGETLPVPAGVGSYKFTQAVASGTTVQVKVTAQPAFETCNPGSSNFSGPITSNITTDTFSCAAVPATSVQVTSFASGTSFNAPAGVAVDSSGNVYVANSAGNDILLISPSGTVSVLAGSGTAGFLDNASGTSAATAEFSSPTGVAVNSSGTIYVADFYNNAIREIQCTSLTASACQVTTVAGAGPGGAGYVNGTGSGAKFDNPLGVAVGPSGNLYVADFNNNAIREVTPAGVVTTVAGSPTTATFNGPAGVAVDSAGNVYVADEFNNEIRMINSSGVVSTLAGSTTAGHADGTGSAASFSQPIDVAVDSAGNVYVADYANNEIRLVSPAGTVSTIAGLPPPTAAGNANGPATTATFDAPSGVAVNASGDVFVGDQNNNEIREIVP